MKVQIYGRDIQCNAERVMVNDLFQCIQQHAEQLRYAEREAEKKNNDRVRIKNTLNEYVRDWMTITGTDVSMITDEHVFNFLTGEIVDRLPKEDAA